MRSPFSIPISADRAWESCFLLLGVYLLFHPPLVHPQSYAVVLGGGLLLLLFKPVAANAFGVMGKPWWLFLLYLFLSSFWSVSPGITLQSSGFAALGTLLYLMGTEREDGAKGRIETAGLVLAAAASLMGLYQRFFGFEELALHLPKLLNDDLKIFTAAAYNQRAFGPLTTSGALGALLILFIPVAFTQAYVHKGLQRLLFAGLTLVLAGGLFATQSVGAWACLTLAALLISTWRRSRTWLLIVLVAGTAGILVLLSHRGLQSWLLASFSMRLELWKSAWSLFLQHPFFGTGSGTFAESYQRAGYSLNTGSRFAHNIPLQLLVETGLTGTLLFLSAVLGLVRRFKVPYRWEGWGVMAGVFAFLLFSLVDLPFQMPELFWILAVVAGRLEARPERTPSLPELPVKWVGSGLLTVLLIGGFWPPFRPWNLALLAGSLWIVLGLLRPRLDRIPLWIFAGGAFIAVRAFFSPSALGAVWFLEMAGLLLAFALLLGALPEPDKFLRRFFFLGLFWAAAVWWYALHYSDIKYWRIFPNPKQVGIFLIALFFISFRKPLDWRSLSAASGAGMGKMKSAAVLLVSAATMLCLKAFAALVGLTAGFLALTKRTQRTWMVGAAVLLVSILLVYRVTVFHSLEKNSTQWDRFSIWGSAVKVWSREPWIGVGPGAFAGYYHQVKSPRASGASRYLMDAQYAHNEYLEFLTAFGLVGGLWAFCLLWSLWPRSHPGKKSALTALGTASLVDFCLHTPLIALQGSGLLARLGSKRTSFSWPGGFLAAGISLGLFGAAAFVPHLQRQAVDLEEKGKFPETLRCLETAERLNAWDSRVVSSRADFLEKLFLATGDPIWERRSREAYERVLALEMTDGFLRLEKARRLFAEERLAKEHHREALWAQQGEQAWKETRELLPFNAFVRFEEGLFLMEAERGTGRIWLSPEENEKDYAPRALASFQRAVELEPSFALAWMNLGLWFKERGSARTARGYFAKALEAHALWKDEDRIDPLERRLVGLTDEQLRFLRKEAAP